MVAFLYGHPPSVDALCLPQIASMPRLGLLQYLLTAVTLALPSPAVSLPSAVVWSAGIQ